MKVIGHPTIWTVQTLKISGCGFPGLEVWPVPIWEVAKVPDGRWFCGFYRVAAGVFMIGIRNPHQPVEAIHPELRNGHRLACDGQCTWATNVPWQLNSPQRQANDLLSAMAGVQWLRSTGDLEFRYLRMRKNLPFVPQCLSHFSVRADRCDNTQPFVGGLYSTTYWSLLGKMNWAVATLW